MKNNKKVYLPLYNSVIYTVVKVSERLLRNILIYFFLI